MSRLISAASAVLCAAGSRARQTAGIAAIRIFTSAAERLGILSTHAGAVRAAITNGCGRIVCAAIVLRRTKRGMRTNRIKDKIMQYAWYDLLGSVGVAVIIITYVLLQTEKIKSESLLYSALNAVGAALILISLVYSFNFPAFVVEFFLDAD